MSKDWALIFVENEVINMITKKFKKYFFFFIIASRDFVKNLDYDATVSKPVT